jgi:ABC-type Fe3+ transport system substrate-binding protein
MKQLILLASLAMVVANPASAQKATISDKLDEVLAAAKREGMLDLVWPSSAYGDDKVARAHVEGMNKVFGTNLGYRFTPGPEIARGGNQLFAEFKAGQPASSDIYIAPPLSLATFIPQGMFIQVPWTKLASGRIAPEMVEGTGAVLRFVTDFSVIAYNTQLMRDPPSSMDELLAPQWKGRLATTPYAAGFDVLGASDFWGRQRTLDYVKRFLPQVAGLIRCGDNERILTGEFAALAIDCSSHGPEMWKSRGAPIDYLVPADAAQMRYYYIAVPAHARHPNAAVLLCLYFLSPEGQERLWRASGSDLQTFPSSHIGVIARKYEAQGVTFKNITMDWWISHPEIGPSTKDVLDLISASR